MKTMWRNLIFQICCILLIGTGVSWAHGAVVIPLFSSKNVANVIRVAKSGGDFSDPVAAANSITDASDSNRYLIIVGPGKYELEEQLILQPFVSIAGSGEWATILQGPISETGGMDSALILCKNKTSVSNMVVYNFGGTGQSVGVYVESGKNVLLQNLRIIAQGGSYNYGIYNFSDNLTVRDGTSTGKGGTFSYGMHNYKADPLVVGMKFNGHGPAGDVSSATMTRGVYNFKSSPTFMNVIAHAADSTDSELTASVGILNSGSVSEPSNPTVMNSELSGEDAGFWFDSFGVDTKLLFNMISPGIGNNPLGSTQCRANYVKETLNSISC